MALTPSASEPLDRAPRGGRVALVLGPEGPGLSLAVMERCRPIGIPMSGGFDSLNVSVASGIALHHFTRQA
jgi:tRNA G18 (ribose-2'-O)-methylase SpoU